MGMSIQECRAALTIDRNALDDAIMHQPEYYEHVARSFAYAVSRRDQAHEDAKRVLASVGAEIRKKLERADEKITEKRIETEAAADARHKEARDTYLAASQEASEWEALKESFSQRSYMLRECAALYIAGYWGAVTVKDKNIQDANYTDTRRRLADKRRGEAK